MNDVLDDEGNGERKRRRIKTSRYEFDVLDNEEHRMIQQALENSKSEYKRVDIVVPEAPTFYPTIEEFKDPLAYIDKIRSIGERAGICKIVPPAEWKPRCMIDFSNPKLFPTKKQKVNTLQEGQGFDEGNYYNIKGYQEMADVFYANWLKKHYNDRDTTHNPPTMEELAKDYWDMVETGTKEATVEYANDIDTLRYASGFVSKAAEILATDSMDMKNIHSGIEPADCKDMFSEDYYSRTGWNLNNLPLCEGSVLKYLQTPINGVNVPWLYIGMLFSSFCWHNEDNYLYSINYSHFGAVKQWYGVPGGEAKLFEKVTKKFLLESFKDAPDLLHHMTTQISPSLLIKNGVNVCSIKQEPRSFVVTFPKAFHCGFSYGFNCGEAVNFATPDWLLAGSESEERYRVFSRSSVFSHHRLLFTLLQNQHEIKSLYSLHDLCNEVLKVLDEEVNSRPYILGQGIRDLSTVRLPSNSFTLIDKNAADYDDLRTCAVCKHVCIFSAIVCECDKVKVSCIRHYNSMCKCNKDKKYLLNWCDTASLKNTSVEVRASLDKIKQAIESHAEYKSKGISIKSE